MTTTRTITRTTATTRVAVIGAGAWGTATGYGPRTQRAHGSGTDPSLGQRAGSLREHRQTPDQRALPARLHPARIDLGHQRSEHARSSGAEMVVSVMPSQHCRGSIRAHGAVLFARRHLFVSCTKGLENGTLLRMTEVIADVLRSRSFTPRIGSAQRAVIC